MPEPTLSVCILARNEADNLPDAIASVADVADEIVVTDTGSTDATIDVAEAAGARVERFAWRDDFSAARNVNLARSTCDWALILDADERLVPESRVALREAIRRDDVACQSLLRRDLVDLDRPDRYTKMPLLRLVNRRWGQAAGRRGVAFRGRCHPQLAADTAAEADATWPMASAEGVELIHHGYVGGLLLDKQRRGLRLLELELADRPGQLYYQIEMLRTCLLLGDDRAEGLLREAASALGEHRDAAVAPLPHAALLLEPMLQWPADRLPEPWTPASVRAVAARWFPDDPPILWRLAAEDFVAERTADAADRLARLVEMGRTGASVSMTSFDPAIVGEEARLNLAACRIRQGMLDAARSLLLPLRTSERVGERARQNLRVIEELTPAKPRYRRRKRRG
jgi:hypothetical protein